MKFISKLYTRRQIKTINETDNLNNRHTTVKKSEKTLSKSVLYYEI